MNTSRPVPWSRIVYTRTAVILHWLIGIAILAEVGFGLYLREIARGSPERGPAVNLHKSIGLVIGLAILVRLVWRFTHSPPPLPSDIPRWQSVAARANHTAMYLCMIVIPFSGYAASNFSKHGINLFNRWVLPPWGSDAPQVYTVLNTLHDVVAYVLLGLVVVHVVATLKHAWIDRDRPFARLSLRHPNS
ncbi:MAG: cytochrome b [Burkholderiaceae bacterium]